MKSAGFHGEIERPLTRNCNPMFEKGLSFLHFYPDKLPRIIAAISFFTNVVLSSGLSPTSLLHGKKASMRVKLVDI